MNVWKWITIVALCTPAYVLFFFLQSKYIYHSESFPWLSNLLSGLVWFSFGGLIALPFSFIRFKTSEDYLIDSQLFRKRKVQWNSITEATLKGPSFCRILVIKTTSKKVLRLPLILKENEDFIGEFEFYTKLSVRKNGSDLSKA